MEKKVCIIIPAKGALLCFDKCFESILSLNYPNYKVILVDDGLEEKSLENLERFRDKIDILKSNSQGPSFARNLAAKNTDADFLAFTDSDCIVDKNWLTELLKGFREHPEAVSCGGAQKLPEDATNFEKKVFLFMKKAGFFSEYARQAKDANITEVNHNASCCVMYKREVFLKEAGFLEGLWPGEDVELDYRLKKKGYKLVFNPKAVVYHYRPKDLGGFLNMMYRYGWAQGFLVRKYGLFRKIQVVGLLSLVGFALFVFGILHNWTIFYLLSLLGIMLIIFLYFSFQVFILTLGSFLWWNAGFWVGFLFPKLLTK